MMMKKKNYPRSDEGVFIIPANAALARQFHLVSVMMVRGGAFSCQCGCKIMEFQKIWRVRCSAHLMQSRLSDLLLLVQSRKYCTGAKTPSQSHAQGTFCEIRCIFDTPSSAGFRFGIKHHKSFPRKTRVKNIKNMSAKTAIPNLGTC